MEIKKMNIGFISSKSYLKYAKVMIKSLLDNNTNAIDIFILSTELDENDIIFFNKLRDNVSAKLIIVDKNIFNNISEFGHYGIYTYFRPICYMFLPENVDRILWLDLDLIIVDSLRDFYDSDFEGNVFVGCEDLIGTVEKCMKEELINKYKLDRNQKIFNAGILLMNIKLLREEDPKLEMISLANEKDLLRFADQDILNVLYGKRIKYVSNKYNFMTMSKNEYTIPPSIIHYAGCIKPDDFRYTDNYSDKFWKYYKIDHRASYFKFMILNKLYRIIRPIFRR